MDDLLTTSLYILRITYNYILIKQTDEQGRTLLIRLF